jgi:NAD(P)-dependent dehydrogenase (short-subunit alcohol dehydrogenase family)
LDWGEKMNIDNLFRLDGRTAFVTGASSGLGVTFAEALSAAGANVVLAARREDRIQDLAARIQSTGGGALAIRCDVGDAAQVEAAIASSWERFGRVDILVNNAGIVAEGPSVPEKVPHEAFEATMRVNLFGTWYCAQSAATRMLADGRGGSIINISSIAGLGGTPDFPVAYHTSKAAVLNLTRSLAVSWADRGVRVNAIAPGWFLTEINEQVLAHPDFRRWAEEGAAMNRIGKSEELIGALLFLASDASSYVTGQTLVVDGGTSVGIGISRLPDSFKALVAEQLPGDMGKSIRPAEKGANAAD